MQFLFKLMVALLFGAMGVGGGFIVAVSLLVLWNAIDDTAFYRSIFPTDDADLPYAILFEFVLIPLLLAGGGITGLVAGWIKAAKSGRTT